MSVIFSSNITLNTQPGDIANRPRLLVDNVFQQGTVTASSEVGADNGWLENAVDGGTYDWWEWTTTPAWLEVTLTTAQPVDMCAIGLHTGLTFVYQYWDGSAWVDLHDAVTTTTTAVHAVIFAEVTASKYRIYISAADDEKILGIAMLGKSLQFPKTFHGGHAPITLNRTTQIVRNRTENGFDAGVYSLRTGAATSVEISNIKPAWIRDNLESLNKDLEIRPFIFAWRPSTYPNDVAYCWLNSPITANNNGPKDYMSMRFDVQAFVGGGSINQIPEYVVAALNAAPGIAIYDAKNNVKVTGHPTFNSPVTSVKFSPSGNLLAVGQSNALDESGVFHLFNVSDWSSINVPTIGAEVGDIAINGTDDLIFMTTNGFNGEPNLRAIEKVGGVWVDKAVPQVIQTVSTQATPVRFNADYTKIYAGDISVSAPFLRIDVATNSIDASAESSYSRSSNYNSVNINGNGDLAVAQNAAGAPKRFGVYNAGISTEKFFLTFKNVQGVCFNAGGDLLAVGVDGQIRFYEVDNYPNYTYAINGIDRFCFSRVKQRLYRVGSNYWRVYDETATLIHELFDPDVLSGYRVSAINGML